jgi:hypothetical protein
MVVFMQTPPKKPFCPFFWKCVMWVFPFVACKVHTTKLVNLVAKLDWTHSVLQKKSKVFQQIVSKHIRRFFFLKKNKRSSDEASRNEQYNHTCMPVLQTKYSPTPPTVIEISTRTHVIQGSTSKFQLFSQRCLHLLVPYPDKMVIKCK